MRAPMPIAKLAKAEPDPVRISAHNSDVSDATKHTAAAKANPQGEPDPDFDQAMGSRSTAVPVTHAASQTAECRKPDLLFAAIAGSPIFNSTRSISAPCFCLFRIDFQHEAYEADAAPQMCPRPQTLPTRTMPRSPIADPASSRPSQEGPFPGTRP